MYAKLAIPHEKHTAFYKRSVFEFYTQERLGEIFRQNTGFGKMSIANFVAGETKACGKIFLTTLIE